MRPFRLGTVWALAVVSCSPSADPIAVIDRDPGFTVDRTSLDFGEVVVGAVPAARSVRIQSSASTVIELSAGPGTPFDPDAFGFELGADRLAPGETTELTVSFTPTDLGLASSSITIAARFDGRRVDREIALRGEGVASQVRASAERLDFGPVRVGARQSRVLTFTNDGSRAATLTLGRSVGAAPCGSDSPFPFCLDLVGANFDDDIRDLGPGERVEVRVVYAPDALNPVDRGQLRFSGCAAPVCDIEVNLEGQPVARAFACDDALDFGAVNPGATIVRDVSCRAVASEPITVTEVVVLQGDAFEVGSIPAGTVVAPDEVGGAGEPLLVPVTFSPELERPETARLLIRYANDTASDLRAEVDLAGRGGGPDIEIAPPEIDCGLTSLLVPARRSLVVRNVGYDPLRIEEVKTSTTGDDAFRVVNGSAEIIPVGEFGEFEVECAPQREGVARSVVEVFSDDADEPVVRVDVRAEGLDLPSCDFALEGVTPSDSLELETVAFGRRLSRTVAVRNRSSTAPCLVNRAGLSIRSDPAFSMVDGELTSTLIPPDSARTFRVAYVPEALGADAAEVELSIASVDAPRLRLPMAGQCVEAAPILAPNDVDFGTIEPGASALTKRVRVFERPGTSLEFVSATLVDASGAFSITDTSTLPDDPGFRFDVGFEPPDASAYVGSIEVVTRLDGALVTQMVNLEGRAAVGARTVDTVRQVDASKVDVLFVIDTSCSNQDDQRAMAFSFDEFLRLARQRGLDYRVGVTTTDLNLENGRLVPTDGTPTDRVTTSASMPSPDEHFGDNIWQGDSGSAIEQALAGADAALHASTLQGPNRGFRRSDARLALLLQIDEPDQSVRSNDYYAAAFEELVGFRRLDQLVLSSISGGLDGCRRGSFDYFPGPELWALTRRLTGGQPDCDDFTRLGWEWAMEELSKPIFGLRDAVRLSNPPVPSTLRVLVDQVELPRTQGGRVNWRHEPEFGRIAFDAEAVPGPGSEIAIEYVIETR